MQESDIAIDAAIFSKNRKFWQLWSQVFQPRPGVTPHPEHWGKLQHQLDNFRFPKFKCNVFLQHKRPEHISSKRGREYIHWKESYFRYDIDDKQQYILNSLEHKLGANAIVVYACPAFWQSEELFDFMLARKLVENSNFVKPSRLNNHRRYTFIESGKAGKAFSKFEGIPKTDIFNELDKLFDIRNESRSNSDFIISLSKAINRVVEEAKQDFRAIYSQAIEYLGLPQHSFGRSLIQISAFMIITNISWLIGYEKLTSSSETLQQ